MEQPSPHILIIDKSSSELDRLQLLLQDSNYSVTVHGDIQTGYKQCLASRPDLILFDVNLSFDRGSLFIRQMKKQYNDLPVPIIVVTQEAELDKRISIMEMGIDDLVIKPYYPEEIVARIHLLLQESNVPYLSSRPAQQGFSGSLKEMNLIDLIQTMELGAKSGIIYLNRGDKEGQVHIHVGKIVDAIVDDYDSIERAFLHMLTWIDGTFSVVIKDIGHDFPPVAANTQKLFIEGAKVIEQWRKETGELPALHTHLIRVESSQTPGIGNEEKLMLRQFQEPCTILQAIDRSEFEDFYALKLIKYLLEKGFLIKTEHERRRDERSSFSVNPQQLRRGIRSSKNKYSQIFSLFRRKRRHEQDMSLNLTLDENDETNLNLKSNYDEKTMNKIALTKAELLLVRQKFSN
ncbi:MAG: response regulator [Calditrichaeota bacterium]|nr:MAG: response regulator [Calditrichota bacterium]